MNFKEEVMSHNIIYSLIYSPSVITYEPIESQIIEIQTKQLEWTKDDLSFYFVWGYPGPDYNKYSQETYGKGWAYTKEEIINAWRKGDKYEI